MTRGGAVEDYETLEPERRSPRRFEHDPKGWLIWTMGWSGLARDVRRTLAEVTAAAGRGALSAP